LDSLGTTTRGTILAASGITLLGVVLPLQLRTRALLKHGVKAQGTVVDVEKETGRVNNRRSRTYHPMVRFTTADGRTVTFTSELGFGRPPRIGSAVPVRYLHDDLEEAEIDRAYIWMLPAASSLLVGVGLLVAAVVAFTAEPRVTPVAVDDLEQPGTVAAPELGPPPAEPPPATVETGRIGDTLTIHDRSGKAQLEIAVTRLKFSTGDGVDQPGLGLYMGMHVEARSLADEQYFVIEAMIDGHTYQGYATLGSAEFEPTFDGFLLDRGDRAAGWLVLDVPARHGQLVLRNQWTDKIGVWTY
jgi:hypothetical protein